MYRFYGADGIAIADLITLDEEEIRQGEDLIFYHPFTDGDLFLLRGGKYAKVEKLLNCVMKDGKICVPTRSLKEIQDYAKESQSHIHRSHKRLINPHIYKVSLSKKLKTLKHDLILEAKGLGNG